jgi:hypothetical protein
LTNKDDVRSCDFVADHQGVVDNLASVFNRIDMNMSHITLNRFEGGQKFTLSDAKLAYEWLAKETERFLTALSPARREVWASRVGRPSSTGIINNVSSTSAGVDLVVEGIKVKNC